MRGSAAAAFFAACAVTTGCPKTEAPENDRALRILKAEKERGSRNNPGPPAAPSTPPGDDPNAQLAQIASANESERALRLPAKNDTVHVGTIALKLMKVTTSHSAGNEKMRLTTPDLFVRVQLVSQNVGAQPANLDLAFARMEAGGHSVELSADATRLAGTRELKRAYGVNERQEVVLYFEASPEALIKDAVLLLPASAGGAEDVRMPLE